MTNLYIDLETLPDQSPGALDDAKSRIEAPANYVDSKKIEAYIARKGAKAFTETSLDALYGELVSIAWAIDDGEIQAFTRHSADEEVFLLTEFFDYMELENWTQGRTWIGHRIIPFDLPFLMKRCWINNIQPPFDIPIHARHGRYVFDTEQEWAGYRGYCKQSALVKAFGIDSVQDFDGSMVWDAWQKGEYDKIRDHNKQDVYELREIYRRMVWM